MVPVNRLTLENEHHYQREDGERYSFLNHLELQEVERSAVSRKADAVSRHREAVFEECDSPRKKDDQNQRPARGNLHFAQFEMAIPGECHKNIRSNQHQNSPNPVHYLVKSISIFFPVSENQRHAEHETTEIRCIYRKPDAVCPYQRRQQEHKTEFQHQIPHEGDHSRHLPVSEPGEPGGSEEVDSGNEETNHIQADCVLRESRQFGIIAYEEAGGRPGG